MRPKSLSYPSLVLLTLGRLALALIFLKTAYDIMRPPLGQTWSLTSIKYALANYTMGLDSYQILPLWMVLIIGRILPPFMLVVGLWLISGYALRFSAIASTLIIVFFLIATWIAHARANVPVAAAGRIRDLVLLAIAIAVTSGAFINEKRKREAMP
jgi:hypothetical protein